MSYPDENPPARLALPLDAPDPFAEPSAEPDTHDRPVADSLEDDRDPPLLDPFDGFTAEPDVHDCPVVDSYGYLWDQAPAGVGAAE